jgi:chitinase
MAKMVPVRLFRALPTGLLVLVACSIPAFAQSHKILGDTSKSGASTMPDTTSPTCQQNGVANKLTHLIYAFANVTTTPAPACVLADTWADYQSPYLPSVSGAPYRGPLYGNFGAIQQLEQLHPNLNVLISIGGPSAANTAAFATAASTAAGRQALAASCISLFIEGNMAQGITAPGLFNRINIDWEFPTASDTQNFSALLLEFCKQLNQLSLTTGGK